MDFEALMQQIFGSMQNQDWQGMMNNYFGGNAPTPPDYSDLIGNLQDMSGSLDELFNPEQKFNLLSSLRQQGGTDIGSAVAGANRAAGGMGAASGLYGSAPMQSQVAQNFGMGANAMTGMNANIAQTGMQYDQNFMNSILARAGIQGNIGNLYNQDFQNQFALADWQAGAFPNWMSGITGLEGLNQARGGGGGF